MKKVRRLAIAIMIVASLLAVVVPVKPATAAPVAVSLQVALVEAAMLPSAAAKTKHCDLEAGWSVAMKFKLSKNVALTYWGANLSKELTAYCYLAQRKSVTKGSYMTLAIDGVGRYTSGKSITRLVRLSDRCIQAAVMLFKKKDGNPHTYWKGELSSRQCG